MVGVNGSGKTTTIGKLARQWTAAGKSVVLAAGDTFRAAAIEQLRIWGERTGCPVIERPHGSEAAALAYDALVEARARGADVLLIDTAGRLQNKAALMEELAKVIRVLKKQDPEAPHATVLVLDGTVGQNAHQQVKAFREMVNVTGLIVTKLDGSARGGIVVALAQSQGLPVHAVGVGEGVDDLRPFEPEAFARSLMGIEGRALRRRGPQPLIRRSVNGFRLRPACGGPVRNDDERWRRPPRLARSPQDRGRPPRLARSPRFRHSGRTRVSAVEPEPTERRALALRARRPGPPSAGPAPPCR